MASFTNQAHLSYNGRSVASNVVTGQMLSPLTLTKTAVVDTYAPTDTVTYVITIVNSGATAYTDLTLTDDLGAYAAGGQTVYPLSDTPDSAVWFLNGTRQADPTASGAPLLISGLSVPAGGNAVILYEAATTDAAPLAEGCEITNAVTLTGSGIGTPLTAQATVTVEAHRTARGEERHRGGERQPDLHLPDPERGQSARRGGRDRGRDRHLRSDPPRSDRHPQRPAPCGHDGLHL